MDAGTMAAIITAISGIASAASQKGGLLGSREKHSSTYGKGGQNLVKDIQDFAQGGFAQGDITQNQGYQQGQDWLNGLFGNDPAFWDKFEAPINRNYEENTIPDLANRFASMGSGGSLGSTGFRNQATREAGNLNTNLAALRGGMQQQGVNQQLGYAQQPISNWQQLIQQALTPTENKYQGPSTGLLGGVASGIISGAAQGYGNQWGQNMAGTSQPQSQQPQSSQYQPYSGMGNSSYQSGLPNFNPNYRTPGQSPLTY